MINVLLVEDFPTNAELIERELQRRRLNCKVMRVENAKSLSLDSSDNFPTSSSSIIHCRPSMDLVH